MGTSYFRFDVARSGIASQMQSHGRFSPNGPTVLPSFGYRHGMASAKCTGDIPIPSPNDSCVVRYGRMVSSLLPDVSHEQVFIGGSFLLCKMAHDYARWRVCAVFESCFFFSVLSFETTYVVLLHLMFDAIRCHRVYGSR